MQNSSMLRKTIASLLVSTLFTGLLSGCGTDSEPLSSIEESMATDTQATILSSEKITEASTDTVSSDKIYSCDYFAVYECENWNIGYSEDCSVSFYSTINYSEGTPTNYTAFKADDSTSHLSAEVTALELCMDYEENSGFELLVNETVDFRGYEASHLQFLKDENSYYEYYFFEINDVLFTVFSNLSAENYEVLHEESVKLIDQFELVIDETPVAETLESFVNTAEITMQDIIDANRLSSILSRYENIMIEMSIGDLTQEFYADNDITCLIYGDGSYKGIMKDRACSFDNTVYGMQYQTQFVLGDTDSSMYEECILSEQYSGNERITDTYESDGLLTVITEMNEKDSAYFMLSYGADLANGDTVVTQYTLKPDDHTVMNSMISLRHTDGRTEEFLSITVIPETERPAEAQDIFEHMTLPDTRTITLIMEPGTASEEVLSTVGIQGDPIQFISHDDSGSRISKYEDEACTLQYTVATDNDKSSDLTIYGKYW